MHRVVQLFANTQSGNFRATRLRELVTRLENEGAEVIITSEAPFALAGSNVTEIAVLGGDGTIRDVVSCLLREGVVLPMRISPAGTVNLLYRELSELQAVQSLYYPGRSQGQAMLICASAGPDSRIVASVSTTLKRWIGRGAYVAAAMRQLIFWRDESFHLDIDGQLISCAAFYLAKGRYYAGPWSFAPDARGMDPIFHGVALSEGGRRAYLRFLADLVFGRTDRGKGLVHFKGRTIHIRSDTSSPVQIDGDCAHECPIKLSVATQPISISLF